MTRRTLTVALLALLALAACGGDDDTSTTTAPVDAATCATVDEVYDTAVAAWQAENDGTEPTADQLLDAGYVDAETVVLVVQCD